MRLIAFTLAAALVSAPLITAADDATKTAERLDDAATLFSEVMSTPDKSIPQDLLNKAYCLVLVPGLKKGAFLVGGKFGRGYWISAAQAVRDGVRRRPSASKAAALVCKPGSLRAT